MPGSHSSYSMEAARAKGLPVIYTTGEWRPDNWDVGSWRWKSTRGDEATSTVHGGVDGNEEKLPYKSANFRFLARFRPPSNPLPPCAPCGFATLERSPPALR